MEEMGKTQLETSWVSTSTVVILIVVLFVGLILGILYKSTNCLSNKRIFGMGKLSTV